MSLLTEIRDLAVKSDFPVADLLRRCAVLASELKNHELKEWAFLELKGYPGDATLPSYRVQSAHALGNLSGPFGSGYKGITIPASILPEKMRDYAERVLLRQPIAEIEALGALDETKGYISCPWPGDLIGMMQNKFGTGLSLYAAWQVLTNPGAHLN